MEIRPVRAEDASPITDIYNHYIAISHATFEVESIHAVEMLRRIVAAMDGGYPFIVCTEDGEVIGYAYGHPFRARPAYRHSIEISVYLKPVMSATVSVRLSMKSYLLK